MNDAGVYGLHISKFETTLEYRQGQVLNSFLYNGKQWRKNMQNALEISIKVWKNIHLKMTCQNAEVGTIILVSLIIGALVAFALYLDLKREELIFKREEWVFKREKLKMKDMTQNRKQLEKKRRTKKLDLEAETQQSERKKQKKKKRR